MVGSIVITKKPENNDSLSKSLVLNIQPIYDGLSIIKNSVYLGIEFFMTTSKKIFILYNKR
jgi:hypothetical protein